MKNREREREGQLENSASVWGVNWDSSFCTLISRVAIQPCSSLRGPPAAPHLHCSGKREKGGPPAACCAIVNTLHISRTIPRTLRPHRHLFNHCPSLSLLSPHTDASQLAEIDCTKVHDGTVLYISPRVSPGETRFRFFPRRV